MGIKVTKKYFSTFEGGSWTIRMKLVTMFNCSTCKSALCTTNAITHCEFREEVRALDKSFYEIEDRIYTLRLKAMQLGYKGTSLERLRMELRNKIMPLSDNVVSSLALSYLSPEQYKRKNDEEETRTPNDVRWESPEQTAVSYSTAGMDFLENGNVRCQTCRMFWDQNISGECLCGITYHGSDREHLDFTPSREQVLDFLENGLVRCRDCQFEWDGNAQHECTYDANA